MPSLSTYEGKEPPELPRILKRKSPELVAWGSAGKHAKYFNKLCQLLGKAEDSDRKLILSMTQKMAKR
jgi:hypothetical protein